MSDRDDLFDVDPPEEQDVADGQDEDFFFDLNEEEQPEDDLREGETATTPLPPLVEEEPAKEKGGSRQRILLFLLLVLVLAGAAYVYLGDLFFEPEPPPAPQVVKSQPQKLKVPERKQVQQEEKAVEEVVMSSEAVSGTPVEKDPSGEQQSLAAVEKTVEQKVEEAPAETVEPQQVKSASEAPPVEKNEVVVTSETVAEPPVREETTPADTPAAETVVKEAPYVLQIGAYVLDSNLSLTLKKVKELGFEPVISEGKKSVSMTRLRLGAYPESVAREKLAELKRLVPDAFLLREGDQMALYAGSYYGIDKARVQADRLYQHDVKIDEETVAIAIPINMVSFGGFSDYNEARIIADKAKAAGLEALIVKRK